MAVKYQVERRPIGETGKVYRGTGYGDYIVLPTNPKGLYDSKTGVFGGTQVVSSTSEAYFIQVGDAVPPLGTVSPSKTHFKEVNGEPWLVHSSHFSVESALESAAPLAGAIGKDNIRIVKVLNHTTTFKLN